MINMEPFKQAGGQAGRPELEHTGSKVLFIQFTCLVMVEGNKQSDRPSIALPRQHKDGAAGHEEPLSAVRIVRISLRFRSL